MILSIIHQLQETYNVDREERCGLDHELERRSPGIARPSIRLMPRNRGAALITVDSHRSPAFVYVSASGPLCPIHRAVPSLDLKINVM